MQKPKTKTKKVYDYNNVDIDGLTNYIKNYDYDNTVFSQPILRQADIFNEILINAFSQFIPCKIVTIKHNDQPWCNNFTSYYYTEKTGLIWHIKN